MKLFLYCYPLTTVVATVLAGVVQHERAQEVYVMLPTCVPPSLENDPNASFPAEAGYCSSDSSATDDYEDDTVGYSEASYQVTSPATLKSDQLGSDLGEPQVIDGEYSEEIAQRIADARTYMTEKVMLHPKYEKVRDICRNEHSNCAFWSAIGECEANPGYMQVHCAPVCRSCDMLHVETRCPLDPNARDALYPGDLNAMFENIVTHPEMAQYQPVVVSRPTYAPGDTAENATYQLGMWLIMFENMLSQEEAERMIELGGMEGYERSSDVGDEKKDGTYDSYVNSGRTSTNSWCNNVCYQDPISQRIMERIVNITGIPEPNSEYLQMLKYEESQFYQTHNDYIEYQMDRPCGVRILTFYMYLNDVEEGGGTNFPQLNVTVTPKRGRAVLWPSVFDHNPHQKDRRSDHQALPVKKGVKYGANAWIHQRDFKTSNNHGCS